MESLHVSPGSLVAPIVSYLNIHYHDSFVSIAAFFDSLISSIIHVLSLAPPPAIIGVLSMMSLVVAGWRSGLICAAGLGLCASLDMWAATVETIAVILLAVVFSVLAGVPAGVLLSRSDRLRAAVRPLLDVMQTLPPWVYLVPAVILFGLGVVPALLSTIIYGIPPMIRIAILAMSQIPGSRVELGHAIGASRREIFWKIELPSAMPTLLVGVNQCILFSLGMVVLAGLVGAGGLGSEVTRGLSRMEFGLGMRASIAIVALAIVFDRVFRGAIPQKYLTHA